MFLEKCLSNNEALIKCAIDLHKNGEILPDTYILDLDTITQNAKAIVDKAKEDGIKVFFMLKQIGRNPMVAKRLMEIGYDGCVAVDYKEALVMVQNGIHLGNVGHLVQTPKKALEKIISSKPDVMTVYTKEKILEINEVAKKLDLVQNLMIRITDEDARLYSGQVAGFSSTELNDLIDFIESLSNVKIGGVTSFPATLYDEKENAIKATSNINGLNRAVEILKNRNYNDILINIPSANCTSTMELIKKLGGNNIEPGHGLTGTTPLHKHTDQVEKVAYLYVSEVSHNYKDKAYCYGGGHYRRGHLENCLVGDSFENLVSKKIVAPDDDSIDYHFEIDSNSNVSDTVLMCFRTQVFTTRSHVAVVEGIKTGNHVVSLYDPWGNKVEVNW